MNKFIHDGIWKISINLSLMLFLFFSQFYLFIRSFYFIKIFLCIREYDLKREVNFKMISKTVCICCSKVMKGGNRSNRKWWLHGFFICYFFFTHTLTQTHRVVSVIEIPLDFLGVFLCGHPQMRVCFDEIKVGIGEMTGHFY